MKIGQDPRPMIDLKQKEERLSGKSGDVFGKAVASHQEKLQSDQLGALLKDVEKQGQRLAQYQTMRDFSQYKQLVQRFVKEAVDFGMNLKHSRGWNSQGRQQTTRLVQEVDAKLLEMADLMKEEKSIGLLDKIGEMKGLLINLYT
ncbi:YaaR family protein [Fictibacillus terranigra]|uniref:YaaR family protein n=1 Tax=Fictibacillus terranigra TaxID=3058424 RepID=A0ABT8EE61_9BACL|nr:YaaR family protein [Fictibacillus sp. CENA-BCM004]MDN4076223.1 YaaR family protein [Fictibacillus sp. CENA-BCM004]